MSQKTVYLFIKLFLLLTTNGLSAFVKAQSISISATKPPTAIFINDTIQAIHHLFHERRTGATILLGVGVIAISIPPYFLPSGVLLGVGLAKQERFTKKEEISLITTYRNGIPLPPTIRRRLISRHFTPSAQVLSTAVPDTLISTPAIRSDTLISTPAVMSDTVISTPAVMSIDIARNAIDSIDQQDTIRAIHRLFNARRGGSAANIVLGIVVIGAGIALAAAARAASNAITNSYTTVFLNSSAKANATSPSGLTYSLPGLLITGIGLIKSARFNKETEQTLIEAYENGVPLPASIRLKLLPLYFQ